MSIKSCLLGFVVGIIFTVSVVGVLVFFSSDDTDPIQYLEQPISYENKTKTSFKVIQVLGNAALAKEISNEKYGWYNGNTVMILGENYYDDQVVSVKDPQRVGSYSYTNKLDIKMTVPVIAGDFE